MSISESLTTVRELCHGKDWFHDVLPGDHDRIIVCVNRMDNEAHTLIPDFVNKHQVLVHYASYYSVEKDKFTEKLSSPAMASGKPYSCSFILLPPVCLHHPNQLYASLHL